MKKIALLLVICLCALSVFSCSKESAPEGLQLCRGGEEYGFTFYVPEGWTNSYFGEVAGAYVTAVNPTSVTLVKISPETTDKVAYFDAHKGEFPYTITEIAMGETIVFGNADEAKSFLYTYEYDGHKFETLQIIASFGASTYLFTYNSFNEPYEDTEETCYTHYFEYVKQIFTTVSFYGVKAAEKTDFEKDADGYASVCDKTVTHFDFWLSPAFTLFSADGMVSAKTEDGATLTMTEATSTGVAVDTYFENRIAALEGIVTGVSVIQENEKTSFGDAQNALAYEYTYVYGTKTMHVYQIISVTKSRGFVYTYTAPEEVYETYLPDVLKMAEKVTFS